MLKVGLTGGIGSGKSIVARVFEVLGVPVFAADLEARRLMETDAAVRNAVIARFGADIYPGGRLDRAKLAAAAFGNDEHVTALNALVHPAVRKAFSRWAGQQNVPYVIMEAALMAENEGHRSFDRVITVSAPEDLRIRRVMDRDGSGAEQVRARMRHQATEEERQRIASYTITNDGNALVVPQVLAIHEQLLKLAAT